MPMLYFVLLHTACARKQLFRATAGLTLDEQLQVAAQLQSNGASVLQV